jgi:hypothetical protein
MNLKMLSIQFGLIVNLIQIKCTEVANVVRETQSSLESRPGESQHHSMSRVKLFRLNRIAQQLDVGGILSLSIHQSVVVSIRDVASEE